MSADKQNVLVTGSSGSLGSFLCREFLKEGRRVTGIDLKKPAGDNKNRELWRFFPCDLSDGAQVRTVLETAHASGPFDVVINNAGLIYNSPLLHFEGGKLEVHDFDAWDKVIVSTLNAAFYVTALCAQRMASAARPGVVINISSICAAGNAGQSAYSAAKAGINAMTSALAKELGPLGIRIAAIAPGFLDMPSTRAHLSEDKTVQIRKSVPLRRFGRPEELMRAIRFILEDEYFHGKVLKLDGGLVL